jgi:hypothetical protein
MEANGAAEKLDTFLPFNQATLNREDLLTDSAEDPFFETIEFIKATPRANLAKTTEKASHSAEIKRFVA